MSAANHRETCLDAFKPWRMPRGDSPDRDMLVELQWRTMYVTTELNHWHHRPVAWLPISHLVAKITEKNNLVARLISSFSPPHGFDALWYKQFSDMHTMARPDRLVCHGKLECVTPNTLISMPNSICCLCYRGHLFVGVFIAVTIVGYCCCCCCCRVLLCLSFPSNLKREIKNKTRNRMNRCRKSW